MIRLLQDANLSSDAQGHALESLKAKLNQTETLLSVEREKRESAGWASAQRESQLEAERTQLSEALASQQKQLEYQQMKMAEHQAGVRNAQNENRLIRKEYEDYKQRAAGILQVHTTNMMGSICSINKFLDVEICVYHICKYFVCFKYLVVASYRIWREL